VRAAAEPPFSEIVNSPIAEGIALALAISKVVDPDRLYYSRGGARRERESISGKRRPIEDRDGAS
jgi:hypothetical protein